MIHIWKKKNSTFSNSSDSSNQDVSFVISENTSWDLQDLGFIRGGKEGNRKSDTK